MKKILLVSLLVLSLALAACNNDNDAKDKKIDTPTENKYTVALVMKTLTNPFFIEMEKGARQAASELDIELIVRTAAQETSIEQQIQIIETLISENVDAIVVSPGDSEAIIPVLKKAQDAGIVIINIDNQVNPELAESAGLVNVPFISVDNEEGGYLSAQYLSTQIDEPTQVIIFEGIRNAQSAQDRKNGAERAFDENENVEVVAAETANWKIDEAYDVASTLFTEFPDVTAVFASNDMMALGVIQYLNDNERDDVMVAGYDALNEAKDAIRDGDLLATIDQQAALQGYMGVESAVRALNGETLEPIILVDVLLVTNENVDE